MYEIVMMMASDLWVAEWRAAHSGDRALQSCCWVPGSRVMGRKYKIKGNTETFIVWPIHRASTPDHCIDLPGMTANWSIAQLNPTLRPGQGQGKLKISLSDRWSGSGTGTAVENKVPAPRCQDFLYDLNGHSKGARILINRKDHS